jgi:hypothetical protein
MIIIFEKLAELKELNQNIENFVYEAIKLKLATLKPV